MSYSVKKMQAFHFGKKMLRPGREWLQAIRRVGYIGTPKELLEKDPEISPKAPKKEWRPWSERTTEEKIDTFQILENQPELKKLRIILKSYNVKNLEATSATVLEHLLYWWCTHELLGPPRSGNAVRYTQKIIGPVPLPKKRRIYCVLKSPHVNKDSREHFEIVVHRRIIDVLYPRESLPRLLKFVDIPAGVGLQVKLFPFFQPLTSDSAIGAENARQKEEERPREESSYPRNAETYLFFINRGQALRAHKERLLFWCGQLRRRLRTYNS